MTEDYGPFDAVTASHAQEQIARAKEFLAVAERLLGPLANKSPEAS